MLAKKFKFVLALCLLLILVQVVNMALNYQLNRYGIQPRQLHSLWAIITAPFLHASWLHVLNNILGLCIFSALYLVHSLSRYIKSSLFIILLTGLLVWLFGRNAIHVGASGWVFGLWSLCIATACFERRLRNIIIACLVIIFYSGFIYGVLPGKAGVSFESHLFGAIAGILCAYRNSALKIK